MRPELGAGGAGNDTVQVNGSNTDRDIILVSPNGGSGRTAIHFRDVLVSSYQSSGSGG